MALTIWDATDVCEPVHWEVQPSIEQASAIPYWVGTKNGLVVTWLTNTNFHAGCFGRPPDSPAANAAWLRPRAASARGGARSQAASEEAAARQVLRERNSSFDNNLIDH